MKCLSVTLKIASGSVTVEIRIVSGSDQTKFLTLETDGPFDAREIADDYLAYGEAMGLETSFAEVCHA